MFQPQPTPFASSSFASYGLAHDLDFALPVSLGGEGAAGSATGLLYGSQLPLAEHQRHRPSPPQPSPSSLSSSSSSSHHLRRFHHTQFPRHRGHPEPPPPPPSVSSTSSGYASSTLLSSSQQPPQPYNLAVKMEDEQQGQHDMAAQQAAAENYQPVREGPKVGNQVSSDAITQEYAKADPIYVEKTMALPQTYSYYRPILGDGNCGWRAIGFSYFEKLIESGDQGQIESEVARLISLNQMLITVGGYTYFEDFADAMFDLLRDIAQSMGNPSVAQLIMQQRWNDEVASDSIVYYLRLLAATYLKANASAYDPFVPDVGGVQSYCSSSIELPNKEIEQLGIIALVNILLKPVNFVLEIAYLDRSPGSQVNTYRFPEEANGQDESALGTIIYLLFRPNHYDILYRAPPAPPVPAPAAPVSMQVHRVTGFSHNTDITSTQNNLGNYATLDFGPLAMIPGLSIGGMAPLATSATTSPMSDTFAPIQQSSWIPPFPPDSVPVSTPHPAPQQPLVVAAPPPPPTPPAPLSPSSVAESRSSSSVPGPSFRGPPSITKTTMPPSSEYQIRFSPVQLDYDEGKNSFPEPTFQVTTNTFKNSVWNRAHYGNPDFHPEEWSPDDENTDGRIGGRRKIKRET